MKLKNIFAVALAALALTACSDDSESYNTAAGVTVGFVESSFDVTEDQEFFYIPVEVKGEPNGAVRVEIEVAPAPEGATNVAIPDENFIITSYSIVIPKGEKIGKFEVRNVWETGLVNPDLNFSVVIKSVNGADIAGFDKVAATIVNVDNTYTSLLGQWTMTGVNHKGEEVVWPIAMKLPQEPAEEEVGHILEGWGCFGQSEMFFTLWVDISEEGEIEDVYLPGGFFVWNFYQDWGDPIGDGVLVSSIREGKDWIDDPIEGEISADRQEIVFNPDLYYVSRIVTYPDGEFTDYYFYAVKEIKLSRKAPDSPAAE